MKGSTSQRGFTLLEILAVLGILAVTLTIAVLSFDGFGNQLRRAGGALAKDIQGAYFQSIRRAQVFRLSFARVDDQSLYYIEAFRLPEPAPPQEDQEAFQEWEERKRKKEEELAKLSNEEAKELTLLDRGEFELVKEKKLPEGIQVRKILIQDARELEDAHLLFFPTGEMPYTLIVLEEDTGKHFSLVADPLTGRVRTFRREVSEEEWKNRRFED